MVAALFFILLVLFLLGIPVLFVLGLVSFSYVLISDNFNMLIIFPQRMFKGLDMFVLLAIPLFTLAGNLMNAGGISDRLINLVKTVVGHFTGGLAQVNIGTSMLFSGISGSAVADSSAIGSVLIPAMIEDEYDPAFSAAITSVSSTVGPIIPPSIPFVIYASVGSVSVASLFLAGVVPGLMLGFSLMIAAYVYAKRKKIPKRGSFSWSNFIRSLYQSIPALLFPLIILYGILGGVFTPTEAAAIAVIYAIIVGFFIYRELTLKKLLDTIVDSGILLGALAPIVSTAAIFSWILGAERASTIITELLLSITENKYLILVMINVFLLIVGMVLEPASAIILFTPILLPVVTQLGVDPVHFGAILVLNLIIGLSTPPVGVCLFIGCRIGNVSLEKISRAAFPFLLVCVAVLMIITLFPKLVMYLPGLLD
jgi:tripartite ATP-independent transporter DctM subunit